MRFLANENFPLVSVRRLRQVRHDVVSITEETPGVADDHIVARAAREDRIILTFDRDYGELIFRAGHASAPVLYLRYDPLSPAEPADHIIQLLSISGMDLTTRFTVADRQRVRQRPLP